MNRIALIVFLRTYMNITHGYFLLFNAAIIILLACPTQALGDISFHCGENVFDASMALTVIDGLAQKNKKLKCNVAGNENTIKMIVVIHGEITKNDADWFKEYNEKLPQVWLGTTIISLNSSGGDLLAALSIANVIRESKPLMFMAFVRDKHKCYSSCVVILAAAHQRRVDGSVGLHRPYLTSQMASSYGYDDLKGFYDDMHSQLEVYFNFVNISKDVLEIMWRTPSHELYILTEAELKKTGLGVNDSVLVEKNNIELRRLCGQEGPSMEKEYLLLLGKCLGSHFEADKLDKCFGSDAIINHPYSSCGDCKKSLINCANR